MVELADLTAVGGVQPALLPRRGADVAEVRRRHQQGIRVVLVNQLSKCHGEVTQIHAPPVDGRRSGRTARIRAQERNDLEGFSAEQVLQPGDLQLDGVLV